MRAKGSIGYAMPFSVAGVNFLNPVTFEDSGWPAIFTATKEYGDGEEVTDYTPIATSTGPYRGITRELRADDLAVEGWPSRSRKEP